MARDDRGDIVSRVFPRSAPPARATGARAEKSASSNFASRSTCETLKKERASESVAASVARGDHPVGVRVEDAEERRVQRLSSRKMTPRPSGRRAPANPNSPRVEEMVDDVADERLAVRRHVAQARGAHPEGRAAGDAGVTRGGRRPARAFSSGAPTRPKFRDDVCAPAARDSDVPGVRPGRAHPPPQMCPRSRPSARPAFEPPSRPRVAVRRPARARAASPRFSSRRASWRRPRAPRPRGPPIDPNASGGFDADVLIVGAGVSGHLTAASRLVARGRSVRVLRRGAPPRRRARARHPRGRGPRRVLGLAPRRARGGVARGASSAWSGCRRQRLDGGVRTAGGGRAPSGGEYLAPCGPGGGGMAGGYAALAAALEATLPRGRRGAARRGVRAVAARPARARGRVRVDPFTAAESESESAASPDERKQKQLTARRVVIAVPPASPSRGSRSTRRSRPGRRRRWPARRPWAGDWCKVVATFSRVLARPIAPRQRRLQARNDVSGRRRAASVPGHVGSRRRSLRPRRARGRARGRALRPGRVRGARRVRAAGG